MFCCTFLHGVSCGYKRMENWAKKILCSNMVLLFLIIIALIGVVAWDLSSGYQSITGRCVWAGYCLWIGGLSSLLLSSIFLIVNIMAYTGILRSASWHEKHQNKSYKLVYPWICLYFIANCGIMPIGIGLVYLWYDSAPRCSIENDLLKWCQDDILYFWSPVIGVVLLAVLIISLHNWFLMLHVAKSMKDKLNPQPFVRIGSRIVFGLQPTSHGDDSTQYSTLSKSSTLFSYGYI